MQINESMNEVVSKVRGQWDIVRARPQVVEIEKRTRESLGELERRARESLGELEQKAKGRASEVPAQLRGAWEVVVGSIRHGLDVTTREDLAKVVERVDDLARSVERLTKEKIAEVQKKASAPRKQA